MTRMKKVFASHDMLAHAWAQNTFPEGNSGDKRMFFEGPTLYSYGSHFVIGHIMPDGCALMNNNGYSTSTGKHKSIASSAASHRTQYYVPELTELLRYPYALTRDASDTVTDKRAKLERLVKFLTAHWEEMPEDSARYLLTYCGDKRAAKTWSGIVATQERKALKAKQSADRATRKEALDYGAKLAALSDSEVDAKLGVASQGRNGLADVNTKLFHTHRALKAAKRDKQAARVFAILKLGRAIVALEKAKGERKAANRFWTQKAEHFRDYAKQVTQASEPVSAYTLRYLASAAEALAGFNRLKPELREKFSAIYALAHSAEVVREAQERREELERVTREHAAWLSGDTSTRAPYSSTTLLRAIHVTRDDSNAITGGTLQTSRNAEVPLLHAIRAFRFIKLLKERNERLQASRDPQDFPVTAIAWQRNGHSVRVGHFAIDTIWTDGSFRAGCHNIGWAEVERVARALGVFDAAASEEALSERESA